MSQNKINRTALNNYIPFLSKKQHRLYSVAVSSNSNTRLLDLTSKLHSIICGTAQVRSDTAATGMLVAKSENLGIALPPEHSSVLYTNRTTMNLATT